MCRGHCVVDRMCVAGFKFCSCLRECCLTGVAFGGDVFDYEYVCFCMFVSGLVCERMLLYVCGGNLFGGQVFGGKFWW